MPDISGEQEPHPEWNPALERVVQKEGEDAAALFWLHSRANVWSQRRNDWLQIPAILLATTTGFFSATADVFPPVAIGALSVFVGILNTILSYFKYAQRAEAHRIAALLYHKTYKDIEVQLSLPQEQRKDAEKLLGELRSVMERVGETAPPLPLEAVKEFKERFHASETHKPIVANGLDQIQIYRGPPLPPKRSIGTPSTPFVPPPPIQISVLPETPVLSVKKSPSVPKVWK